jgi:hypothetical protein
MEDNPNIQGAENREELPPIPFYKKLLPIGLMGFNVLVFFYLIPGNIAESYSTFFAILGGVITVILSFWIIIVTLPSLLDKAPIVTGILCMSTLFLFGYQYITKTSNFSSQQLRENGVYTDAIIVKKSQFTGRRGRTTQSIRVRFYLHDKKTAEAKILVGSKEYNYFKKGQIISIKYSSKYPEIATIFYRK